MEDKNKDKKQKSRRIYAEMNTKRITNTYF